MSALLFDSLEIRGFRAFRDLRIEKLGRVNLIVGQNNVGKSCLLEALQIYAHRADPTILWQLLGAHDENAQLPQSGHDDVEEMLSIVKNLFYDWPEMTGPVAPIEIGPIDSPEAKLRLSLEFCSSNGEKGQITPQPSLPEEHTRTEKALPCFAVQLGESRQIIYPLEILPTSEPFISEIQPINCIFTDAHSLDKRDISTLWNKVASPDVHQEVLNALRIIAPGLNDIDMVGGIDTKRDYFPIVTATTIAKPLPIRTLGTGIQRMLTIMLALLNAKDGLLLIDEIEHGLHYTAQVELWLLIFEIARRLNIQVFATSHSWDCIVSFQAAAREAAQEDEKDEQKEMKSIQGSKQTEAMLFRLSFRGDDLEAVLYDTQMLKVAARHDIEVR